MNWTRTLKPLYPWLVAIAAVSFLAACAATKPYRGDLDSGLSLRYNLPEHQALTYHLSNTVNQNMEVMGQPMDTDINTLYEFQVESNGLKRNRHQLAVTINSMKMDVNSSQGDFSPDVSAIPGKSFAMILSPVGKELDLSGAESITYNLGPAGSRSIASDFQAFFPDLADRPVKVGDTWTTWDTIRTGDQNMNIRLILQNQHTLQGVETVNGHDCIKVASHVTGIMDGQGYQGGSPLEFSGNIESADTWYFAYKEGIFVKSTSEGTTDASIDAGGMNIPLTIKTRMEASLLE